MERAVLIFAIVQFSIMGLSHILAPKARAHLLKATIYFMFPAVGLRSLA